MDVMEGRHVAAGGLECYECDSSNGGDAHCPERLRARHHPPALTPTSCDRVFEARYCVKTIGMFEGVGVISLPPSLPPSGCLFSFLFNF